MEFNEIITSQLPPGTSIDYSSKHTVLRVIKYQYVDPKLFVWETRWLEIDPKTATAVELICDGAVAIPDYEPVITNVVVTEGPQSMGLASLAIWRDKLWAYENVLTDDGQTVTLRLLGNH